MANLFTLTDELVINVDFISSYSTHVDWDSQRDDRDKLLKSEEGLYITKLVPWLKVSMSNGETHIVKGLKDIYNFLSSERRMWSALVSKINKGLEGDDYHVCFISEEDKEYLTKII